MCLASAPNAKAQVPPQYELTILDADHTDWPDEWPDLHEPDQEPVRILPYGINESGIVVGHGVNLFPHHERAFMYVHETGEMIDLNDLAGAKWIDSVTRVETAAWFARRATGINVNNQIVGNALKDGQSDRFFVLNDPLGPEPTFELLPEIPGSGAYRSSGRINDNGVVAGHADGIFVYAPPSYTPVDTGGTTFFVRDINNNGVVVAGSGASDPGQIIAPDEFGNYSVVYESSSHFFSGINNIGVVTGYQIYNNRGRDKRDGGAIRFDFALWQAWQQPPSTDPEPVPELLKSGQGKDRSRGKVNNNGVIFFGHDESTQTYERGYLYLEEAQASFPLDDYVAFDSIQDEADWFLKQIEPRGINDQGQLICRSDSKGFLLTPADPEPGVTVTPTSGLTTTEDGDQDTFTVKLDTQPTDLVTIGITSNEPNEGLIVDPNNPTGPLLTSLNLTFDSTQAQTVTVQGVDDALEDGDFHYTIITASAISADPDYNGRLVADVDVTNLDNDGVSGGTYEFPAPQPPPGGFPLSIPDRGTVSSTIEVGDNFVIDGMTVSLAIEHDRPSDPRVKLISPIGIEASLSNFNGDNSVSAFDNTNTTGTNSTGTWTLEVRDVKKRVTGDLIDWSISINY